MEGGPVRLYSFQQRPMMLRVHVQTETTAGMIPRAVEQVFAVADELKSKGWAYRMEGQFLEIVSCI